jgi:hypothetical protein
MVQRADDAVARASELLRLFHSPAEGFAVIHPAAADGVGEPYRSLLDHRSHMTVAMEQHHGGPLALRVVQVAPPGIGRLDYAREILLERPSGEVVLYGVVRIDLGAVDEATATAIRAAEVPLGRLLIEAGLLRDVHHVSLLQVAPGDQLTRLFGRSTGAETFGRVAEISLAGRPAVELLEVAAPPQP